jgi:hypothetical protein
MTDNPPDNSAGGPNSAVEKVAAAAVASAQQATVDLGLALGWMHAVTIDEWNNIQDVMMQKAMAKNQGKDPSLTTKGGPPALPGWQ